MGLGRGVGGARWLTDRRDYLNTLIPDEEAYRQYGAMLEGLLIARFTLDRPQLETLVGWMSDLVMDTGDARTQAMTAWYQLQAYFQTGESPEWLDNPARLGAMLESINMELEARYTVGLAVGADVSAAAGAKVRLNAGITGARYTEVDLTEEAPELVADLIAFIATNVSEFFSDNETGETQLAVPPSE